MISHSVAANPEYALAVEKALEHVKEAKLDVHLVLATERFVVFSSGLQLRILEVRAKIHVLRKSAPFPMKALAWRTTPAAFGRGPTPLGDTTMTLIQPSPGHLEALVTVDGKPVEVTWRPTKSEELI
jgi:hypothetical protein